MVEPQNQTPSPADSIQGGALQRNVFMERDMKIYPVDEEQLEHLAWWNAASVALFGIAGAFLGLGIDLIKDLVTDDLSKEAEFALTVSSPIALVAGVLFLAGGIWVQLTRRSQVERIKQNARPVRQTVLNDSPPDRPKSAEEHE